MKKNLMFKIIVGSGLIFLVFACNPDNSRDQKTTDNSNKNTTDPSGKELWAEQVESSISITKPDGWTDEDWKSVAKGIDQEKIFNTVVQAVLKGEKQAYDYITDTTLTIDQVKEKMVTGDITTLDKAGVDANKGPQAIVPKDISTVKCREKWYFDKEKFTLKSEISSIALFTNIYSETGDLKGIKALFYIKLNN